MSLSLTAFGLMAALGSAVFAALAGAACLARVHRATGERGSGTGSPAPPAIGRLVAIGAGGFVASSAWLGPLAVAAPAWAGAPVAALAVLLLFRPHLWFVAAGAAGVAAGTWSAVLHLQGMPLVAALALAGSVPAVSLVLAARREGFAPPDLADESLLGLTVLSLVVAVAPELSAGWDFAALLNADRAPGPGLLMPAWLLIACGGLAALGGFHSLRRRR